MPRCENASPEADTLVAMLRRALPRPGKGWLSEETHDDRSRLGYRHVWVVDRAGARISN